MQRLNLRWRSFASGIFLFVFSIQGMNTFPVTGSVNPWPTLQLTPIANGFTSPVAIANAGDSSNRLFIVEQPGKIVSWTNDQRTIFLDIRDRVRSPANGGGHEEGLLGLAFPPGFGTLRRHFYVYYTNLAGDNQVSRYWLGANSQVADPTREEWIILFLHPGRTNHNGGQMAFGPDQYLYIATGDGGGWGDPENNAQNPSSWLGKILRLDVEQIPHTNIPSTHQLFIPQVVQSRLSSTPAYRIPKDNPFVGQPDSRPEIWAYGLRNPWRFSFDHNSGDMFIADVGQDTWEEVNLLPQTSAGGENFGWKILEGENCFNASNCDSSGMTMPVFTYNHQGGNCSITGGYVYRGSGNPMMQGIYFFADYCSGQIWGLQRDSQNWSAMQLLDTASNISSFGEGDDLELYFSDISGTIYRIDQTTH